MAALTAAGFLLVAMGWLFGRRERHQRRDCDASHARTMAIIRAEHRRLVEHNERQATDLHEAKERIRHLESCNRDLVIRAVLASSPLN